jgi:hypothetical protein
MAIRTPSQRATRRRIEAGIRLAAPFLDLLLAAGDRVSRVAGRDEVDPDPPRHSLPPGEAARLGGGPDPPHPGTATI